MTTDAHVPAAADPDPDEALTPEQKEALQRAVAKIIALGVDAKVSPDQMILLLRSGLTVRELVEYLAAHGNEVA